MPIRVLPHETAAKIAAGEVVERPVSVVKELIENSLDAGASWVDVEVRGGGVALLRVVDNGCGIPASEVEAAFARYATSKIAAPEDLERIGTLGFRGEALASIAAVSEVTLLSRPPDAVGGTAVRVEHGQVRELAPKGAPPGTSVAVKELFRSVPARLKFLKPNAAEAGRVTTLVSQMALAYPEVRFSVTVDGRPAFSSEGNGELRDTLLRVYGAQTAEAMLQIQWGDNVGGVSLSATGMAGPPSVNRAGRGYITLFVNRRLVRNRALTFAVQDAYQGMLMNNRYPIVVLDLSIDPAQIDVNVHPAKAEIRFRDEGIAFAAVRRAVEQALAQAPMARPAGGGPFRPDAVAAQPAWAVTGAEQNSAGTGEQGLSDPPRPAEGAVQGELGLPILRVLGQMARTYIVAEGPEGMYLIDQHAAHERVLFDRVRKEKGGDGVEVQFLLDPVTVELSPQHEAALGEKAGLLRAYGFQIEPFGQRSFLLRSVPAALAGRPPGRSVPDVLEAIEADYLEGYDWEDRLLTVVACHGAIRAGQALERREMEEVVRQLEATDNPRTCPHGRPTMVAMTTNQLEREFGRR